MQPVSVSESRYDRTTIFFHWMIAIMVVTQFSIGRIIAWFSTHNQSIFDHNHKEMVRSVHITTGAILAILLIGRIIWRLTKGRRLSRHEGALGVLAKATHVSLYALLVAQVSAGMTLAGVAGVNYFNLFTFPNNKGLVIQVYDIHGFIAWVLIGVAGLHATAALVHRYIWHDAVLGRMLPNTQLSPE